MMRLQKFLAHAGLCSRRKAEEYIVAGFIKVNEQIVTELGTQVDPACDKIYFNDEPICLKEDTSKIYIAINKPKGYVTSCSQDNSKIILDLIDINARIYPVGRLDKDSTGLLLLTNDGQLHNRMSHPSFNHEKEYIVTTCQPIHNSALKKMAQGIQIEQTITRKADVTRMSKNKFRIVLKQGLNRQIRKMVEAVGNSVDSLCRVRMANIRLGRLKEGNWRYLTSDEIIALTKLQG
ncbi:MAG: pseudouridine synthase [Pseudomonadota bacterium]